MAFAHLHVHTQYSLLDGAARITDLLDKAASLGMNAMAITDHGAMYGVIKFYKEAKKRGIKPIIGCEVYVARDMHEKTSKEYAHLILLAENQKGYENLVYLVSHGFTEGYYYKPRIDYSALAAHAQGLIALSACLSGDIPKLLLDHRYDDAKAFALRMNQIMGQDNFFLELQDCGLAEQRTVNPQLVRLSKETGIPLVVTNDVHYVNSDDAEAQEILMCIQTGKTLEDEQRMRMETKELYLKSEEEMASRFSYVPEALANTTRIAERCCVDFEFGKLKLPRYDVPDGKTAYDYFCELCRDGLKCRYDPVTPELSARLEYEIDMINKMGYVEYYLIVWDFVHFAKANGITVGPGRGSGAASIAAYCMGITDVDPIRYSLIFERFLNPERISMPDFDIDFSDTRRQEVIDYVTRKYGEKRVSQIITFGTMAARAVIRDVGRVMNMSYSDVDRIAKMVPQELNITIDDALQKNPELAALYKNDPKIGKLIDMSLRLEGLPRHTSTHAAGVVISAFPLEEYIPLQLKDDVVTTQFDMKTVEELGLLKMDFLGLRTLTVIQDAIEFIRRGHGVEIDFSRIPMDDPEVFAMISEGDTDGVFQLESPGMRNFMKELKPSSLEDVIAGIALYRPGPMDSIPRYVMCKHDPSKITFKHEKLAPILRVTYGCIVYQEQVMQIVRDIAGYSLGRSDLVRRAMAKKVKDIMVKEKDIFVNGLLDADGNVIVPGALRNGVPAAIATDIFDEMMSFASYAFNKAHAAAYAFLCYRTAYLKRYYLPEFMAALLNSFLGDAAHTSVYINTCERNGVHILPPDINVSQTTFICDNGNIRFGLAGVKNVGINAINAITAERDAHGKFHSVRDLFERIDEHVLNKRMIESLIKAGAFDSFGYTKATLLNGYSSLYDGVITDKKKKSTGQLGLFDLTVSAEALTKRDDDLVPYPEYSRQLLCSMEKEMLGLYLTGNPLADYADEMKKDTFNTSLLIGAAPENNFNGLQHGQSIVTTAIIASKKTKITKNNKMMAFLELLDLYGSIEAACFPKVFEQCSSYLYPDAIIRVWGKLSLDEEKGISILCDDIRPVSKNSVPAEQPEIVFIRIPSRLSLNDVTAFFSRLTGQDDSGVMEVVFCREGENKGFRLSGVKNVRNDEDLANIRAFFGENNVKLK